MSGKSCTNLDYQNVLFRAAAVPRPHKEKARICKSPKHSNKVKSTQSNYNFDMDQFQSWVSTSLFDRIPSYRPSYLVASYHSFNAHKNKFFERTKQLTTEYTSSFSFESHFIECSLQFIGLCIVIVLLKRFLGINLISNRSKRSLSREDQIPSEEYNFQLSKTQSEIERENVERRNHKPNKFAKKDMKKRKWQSAGPILLMLAETRQESKSPIRNEAVNSAAKEEQTVELIMCVYTFPTVSESRQSRYTCLRLFLSKL